MAKIQQKWIDRAGTKFIVDFWDGNNAPYIADVDTFHLYDAAGFPLGVDTDVIFKLDSELVNFAKGFQVEFMYVLSTDNIGQSFRYQLDMVGHILLDQMASYASYGPYITDVPVDVGANRLQEKIVFTISPTTISANTTEIELRVTRKGSATEDTYQGDIGLKQIVIIQS